MGKDTTVEAPKPDPLIGQTAAANAEISKDWLALSKEQFAEGLKRQDVTDALTGKVVEQQLATQDQGNAWAQEDRDRTKTVFQPLQDEFIATARNYDSPEKQAEAAADARAGIARQVQIQQGASERNMAAMGVNPNSGRFAALSKGSDTDIALAQAGAANNARQMVRDKAISLKGDAINLGNGLASSAAAAYGIGTNAGNSAVGNNQSSNQNFYANGVAMNQGFNGAVGANSAAGSTLNALYGTGVSAASAQNQANAQSSGNLISGIGSLAGTGAALFL